MIVQVSPISSRQSPPSLVVDLSVAEAAEVFLSVRDPTIIVNSLSAICTQFCFVLHFVGAESLS